MYTFMDLVLDQSQFAIMAYMIAYILKHDSLERINHFYFTLCSEKSFAWYEYIYFANKSSYLKQEYETPVSKDYDPHGYLN